MKGKDFVSVLKDAHPDVPKIGLKAPVPKIGRLFFFTRMRPGQKMTGSIRFLYYSLSYVNLFKDRLSLSLSLSRRVLCSEKRVQRYGVF